MEWGFRYRNDMIRPKFSPFLLPYFSGSWNRHPRWVFPRPSSAGSSSKLVQVARVKQDKTWAETTANERRAN